MEKCYEIRIILSTDGLSWAGVTKPAQNSTSLGNIQNSREKEQPKTIEQAADGPPVLGLSLITAEELGLISIQKEIFINFMAARFPEETDETYIKEWAGRFWVKREALYCDENSAKILELIRKTLSGEYPLVKMEVSH